MLRLLRSLNSRPKEMLRDMGRRLGLEIKLRTSYNCDDLRIVHFLKLFNINLVLDVGANRGQYAQALFRAGYPGKILSFEALPEAHELLANAAAQRHQTWTVAPRVALSDRSGFAEFHKTEIDTSSSLFAPADSFVASRIQARVVETLKVPTARLDDVVSDIGLSVEGCLLKMDVQGGESLVMAGAPNVLAQARGLMAELSLTALYEGQPSSRVLLEEIYAAGFEIWDIWQGYRDPHSHRLNQVDIICFKTAEAVGSAR